MDVKGTSLPQHDISAFMRMPCTRCGGVGKEPKATEQSKDVPQTDEELADLATLYANATLATDKRVVAHDFEMGWRAARDAFQAKDDAFEINQPCGEMQVGTMPLNYCVRDLRHRGSHRAGNGDVFSA